MVFSSRSSVAHSARAPSPTSAVQAGLFAFALTSFYGCEGVTGPDPNERNGFDIALTIPNWVEEPVHEAITEAASRWAAILADTEFTNITLEDEARCGGYDVGGEVVDDVMILLRFPESIPDGVARAGICTERTKAYTPGVGYVSLKRSAIDQLLELGLLGAVVLHEIAHVLGFGTTWDKLYLVEGTPSAHFTGPLARAAFDAAGGEGYPGAKVPTENDYDHWRQAVFGSELMTRVLATNRAGVLSAVTLQSFADMGYEVDLSLAEDYLLPVTGSRPAEEKGGWLLDLSGDLDHGPVTLVVAGDRSIRR